MSFLENFDLFPAQIGFARAGKASFKTKLGGCYTIIISLFTLIYTMILIMEPLKASKISTFSNAGFEVGGYDDSSSLSVGSRLSETTDINGVEFQGTYQVHKYSHYIRNATLNNEKTFMPHQQGFQIAFKLPANYNTSIYTLDMYSYIATNLSFHYEYVEHDLCNITDFPEEVREELLQYGIEDMVWPVSKELEYNGHLYGINSKHFSVEVILCNGEDYWINNYPIDNVAGTYIEYLYIDARYDYNDLENPIHYRVNYENSILADDKHFYSQFIKLHPNIAYSSNGTNTTFFSAEYEKLWHYYVDGSLLSLVYFALADDYEVYVPYIDYQPVVSSNRRNLASNDDNIMSTHYFIFYMLAQIGGFSAFFILLLGQKIKSINENYLMHLTINDYNSIVNQYEQHLNEENDSSNHFEKSKINYKNSRNKSRNRLSKRNSIANEQDDLVQQNEGGSSEDEQDQQQVPIMSQTNQKNRNLLSKPLTRGRSKIKTARKNRIKDIQTSIGTDQKPKVINYESKDLLYNLLCCF